MDKQITLGGPKKAPPGLIGSASGDLSELQRRIRILEERYTNLRRNIQVTEQNIMTDTKKLFSEIKTTNSDLVDLKREIAKFQEDIGMIKDELKETAKKEEVKVLEKYINLWEPLNFITRQEVEKIIKEILDKKETKKEEDKSFSFETKAL